MSTSEEQDRRLVQPAQAIGGAFGGIAGATLGARLASRFGMRGATRFGQRLGAMFRMQASRVPGATAVTGASVRHASHLISRFGSLGAKGGAIGAAIGAGSAAGDYLGDYAGRRVVGAQGRNDEYRHVSGLGLIAGAAAGAGAHGVMRGMRRLRRVGQIRRSLFATSAGAAGAVAGEAAGNVHDQRYAFTENLVGTDRRLTTLGKSWLSSYQNRATSRTSRAMAGGGDLEDPRRGYGSGFQRSWVPSAGRLTATGGATGGSTMASAPSSALQDLNRKRRAAAGTSRFSPITQRLFAGQGAVMTGSLFSAFGKRAPGAPLSDAERKQRVEAGKASAEARRKKGGTEQAAARHMTAPWGELTPDEKTQAYMDGRKVPWGDLSREEKRIVYIAGGVAAGGVAAAVGVPQAVKAGKQAARRLTAARAYGAKLHAGQRVEESRRRAIRDQTGDAARLAQPGERIVFRGAPEPDPKPKTRRYRAIYAAQDPHISQGYAGRYTSGASQPRGWHGAFAIQPGTRLFHTGKGAESTPMGRRVARAQDGGPWASRRLDSGDLAVREGPGSYAVVPPNAPKGAETRPATLAELAEIGRKRRADFDRHLQSGSGGAMLSDAHTAPSAATVRYLRRAGYHGTQGESGNIAIFDENRLRFLKEIPGIIDADADEPARAASLAAFHNFRRTTGGDTAEAARARRDAARLASARSWGRSLVRRVARLGKRAPGAPLSDAERKQRVEAGKASAEARRGLRGAAGAGPRLKQPAWYRRTRIAHDDPDFDGQGRDQAATTPGGSGYLENERKPQVPKGWGENRYLDLARWSAETAKAQHERITTDGRNKRMIPEGTDDKTVRLALDHTRNLAMHDVGLWNYRFRMTPEAKEQLQPLWRSGFLWHARRAQANAMRQGRPGEYADLRREFGTPFKDKRTYAQPTRGHEAGEEKKRFYRHLQLVKRWAAPPLSAPA